MKSQEDSIDLGRIRRKGGSIEIMRGSNSASNRGERICKALGFPPNPFERAPHKSAYEVLFHTRHEIAYFFSFSFAMWFYLGTVPFPSTHGQQSDFKIAMFCIFLLVSGFTAFGVVELYDIYSSPLPFFNSTGFFLNFNRLSRFHT